MQDSAAHRGPVGRPLNEQTLAGHARRVAAPQYDRAALAPAVVHLGVGGFHRSHQAVYFDDVAQRGVSLDWGIIGVGLRSRKMQDVLDAQDGLYTLIERGPEADSPRVIGAITRHLFAPARPEAVLAILADPRKRLVTMTVTGVAYGIDPATGAFDPHAPGVAADVAHPRRPSTVLGYLTEALDRRRRRGDPPFTVLSCDNLTDNGAVTRAALSSFAALRDDRLATWIEEHVGFPSSMVDRITPRTTAGDREGLAAGFGIRDRWPVVAEPFSQWIVEDEFSHGRPPLDEVGARFVSDVRPYSLTKTWLLNGSHCALGHLGLPIGHRRIDEAMRDPLLRLFVARLMRDEVSPLLPPVPGLDLDAYRRELFERFSHPKLGDRLERLARNGSVKLPAHLLAAVAQARAAGRPHRLLTLAVAGWLRHLSGVDDHGRRFEVQDPLAPGRRDPAALLRDERLFGDLAADAGFTRDVEQTLSFMEALGTHASLRMHLAVSERGLDAGPLLHP